LQDKEVAKDPPPATAPFAMRIATKKEIAPASGTAVKIPEKEKLSIANPASFPGELSRTWKASETKFHGWPKTDTVFLYTICYNRPSRCIPQRGRSLKIRK
jgi:hypothetical protein